nr:MAG TPA: hypothetical protein [Bacteriophage sp.]
MILYILLSLYHIDRSIQKYLLHFLMYLYYLIH